MGVVVISRDTSLTQSQVAPFFTSHEYTFPVLLDGDQQIATLYSADTCPDTFVILADGSIVYQKIGYLAGNEVELLDIVAKCLAGNPPPAVEQIEKPATSSMVSTDDPLLQAIFDAGAAEPGHIVTTDEIKKCFSNFIIKQDDIEGYTWYRSMASAYYLSTNFIGLYIGSHGNSVPWLRLRIQYAGDDWLFINEYAIKTDDDLVYITVGDNEIAREAGYGEVYEWLDRDLTLQDFSTLQAIMKSKSPKIRCKGTHFSNDRLISITEIRALQETINLYELLILANQQGVPIPTQR